MDCKMGLSEARPHPQCVGECGLNHVDITLDSCRRLTAGHEARSDEVTATPPSPVCRFEAPFLAPSLKKTRTAKHATATRFRNWQIRRRFRKWPAVQH